MELTGNNEMITSRDLLKKINEKGTTVLVVTHELDTLKYGKKVYTMSEGILEDGKKL